MSFVAERHHAGSLFFHSSRTGAHDRDLPALAMAGLCASEHTRGALARIILDMKLPEVSAEAALQYEMDALAEWLAAQGLDLRSDKAHSDEGSRDRLYCVTATSPV